MRYRKNCDIKWETASYRTEIRDIGGELVAMSENVRGRGKCGREEGIILQMYIFLAQELCITWEAT